MVDLLADAPQPPPAVSAKRAKTEPTLATVQGEPPAWEKAAAYRKATAFVNKIKKRFDDSATYELFLHLLQMYEMRKIGVDPMYEIVKVMFKYHPDLIEGFTYYLPAGHPSATGPLAAGGGTGAARNSVGKPAGAA